MSVVKINGGSLRVQALPGESGIALVCECDKDDQGPAMKLSVVMSTEDGAILNCEIATAIQDATPNTSALDAIRARHLAVFGDRNVPDWVRDSIARYVDHGIPTGDLLRAVLANDLQGAFARADVATAKAMPAIVAWIYNRVPAHLCGNYAVVDTYVHAKVDERRRAREQGGQS